MLLTKEEVTLLDLQENEVLILNALEENPGLSMQDLSECVEVPRTTLYWPVSQLEERGLVESQLFGKRKKYFSSLKDSLVRRVTGTLETHSGEMRVYTGAEELKELYKTALALHPGERLTIVEGKRAALSVAEKAGIDFIVDWHTVAIEKSLVLESILSKSSISALETGGINQNIVNSLSRFVLWVGYMVNDELLDVDSAILVFRDSLILADWKAERGVFVNNREIVRMMNNLVEVYRANSEKLDIVAHVKRAATTKE